MQSEKIHKKIKAILDEAEKRARTNNLAYRGAVTPDEAWQLMQTGGARLIDVRSSAEWNLVGRVPGAIEVELKHYPDWRLNPNFVDEVRRAVATDDLLLFLCRSAQRSHEAAALLTVAGYANCFNILEGFEGDKNADKQRVVAGWRVRQLPWSH